MSRAIKAVLAVCLLPAALMLQGCAGCGSGSGGTAPYYAAAEVPEHAADLPGSRAKQLPGKRTVIKMIPSKGIYKIPVSINGQELEFFFDTGAGMISMSEVEAAFLLKQGKISEEDFIGEANFINANGERSATPVVRLRDVTIGDITIHDVEASVVANTAAPLLLGQSFLARFGRISIDYEANEISFE